MSCCAHGEPSYTACRSGCIAGVLEAAKKGTLKVDLQALTVGAALLTMHRCAVHL